ncbi:hypothetical protein D3C72_2077780 [compost metagenome]
MASAVDAVASDASMRLRMVSSAASCARISDSSGNTSVDIAARIAIWPMVTDWVFQSRTVRSMGSCSRASVVAWLLVACPVIQVVVPSKATARPSNPKLAASFCPTLRLRPRPEWP